MRYQTNTISEISAKPLSVFAEKGITLYNEYRINQNTVLRYMSVCTPCFAGSVYSALIIRNEDETDVETKFIYDIARNGKDAYRIMKLISDNGVTPDTAEEIIVEIL